MAIVNPSLCVGIQASTCVSDQVTDWIHVQGTFTP
jgi:hypothetical protein